jgi:poly(A) polymerase
MSVTDHPAIKALLDDPALKTLFTVLDTDQHSVRLVGGVVRNALMGRPINDIDMATSHHPEVVMDKALQAGLKVVPTGIAHGTVTVVIEGRSFEITSLREDIETHGRHATVKFGHSYPHDAQRRDFTINALYADARGRLYDYTNGLEDIAKKRLRFIGEAKTRISEDFLRILRFFRFFSDYAEGPIDPEGLKACILMRHGLKQLSRERIGAELIKILVSRRAAETVALMHQGGILGDLLDLPCDVAGFQKLVALAPEADAMTRLLALTHISREGINGLQQSLRLSNQQANGLDKIVQALPRLEPLDELTPFLLTTFRLGIEASCAALRIAASRQSRDRAWLEQRLIEAQAVPLASPFNGQDVMALGLKPGRRVGAAVAEAERLWIEGGFSRDPEVLERHLADAVHYVTE